MYVETHEMFVWGCWMCSHGRQKPTTWRACVYVETHEMFVWGCWMGTHGRQKPTRWRACMYVETHEMFVWGWWMCTHGRPWRGGMGACIWLLFCTSAGCEHSGDQGEAGRGACLYVETHQKLLSGPAESEGTGNHSQQDGGTCISCKEHARSLAHRSKRIHAELVFALLILDSWGCMYFETQAICPSARIDSN